MCIFSFSIYKDFFFKIQAISVKNMCPCFLKYTKILSKLCPQKRKTHSQPSEFPAERGKTFIVKFI